MWLVRPTPPRPGQGTPRAIRPVLYAPLKHAFGADKPDSPFIMKFAAGGASGGMRPGVAIVDFPVGRVN